MTQNRVEEHAGCVGDVFTVVREEEYLSPAQVPDDAVRRVSDRRGPADRRAAPMELVEDGGGDVFGLLDLGEVQEPHTRFELL